MEVIGRFAPTPSGRMHLGNAFSALLAWLDAKSCGGKILLRIEDLDAERCSEELAERLAEDLLWLGLDWDEGGLAPEYRQSRRTAYYQEIFTELAKQGYLYPCFCSRAERLAANAPHTADGAVVYSGRCRDLSAGERQKLIAGGRRPAWRIRVPEQVISLTDGNLGAYSENLAADCGDFIIRRSDGVFAYQLAVAADDAAMGVNHIVRGRDLLSSAPRQIWLHQLLHNAPPRFFHVPLLLAGDGRRLAKRDNSLTIAELRARHAAPEIIGLLAWWAGLLDEPVPVTPQELIGGFDWRRVPAGDIVARLPEGW